MIGHEISHHFDDQGRKFDASGKLSDWWTEADIERFEATVRLRSPLSSATMSRCPASRSTASRPWARTSPTWRAFAIAYDAYKIALGGKPAPVIGGFTGDQRFFLGFAQVWRAKYREPLLQQQLKAGVHTPSHLRSSTVRNFDAWYEAFSVKDGKLYLPPEKRVRIW